MNYLLQRSTLLSLAISACFSISAEAAPVVSRLTPPSQLFATQGAESGPIIARFIPGQRFDLQATVSPDAGKTISDVQFLVDGNPVPGSITLTGGAALNSGLPLDTKVASLRAYTNTLVGVHTLSVKVTQSDNQQTTALGNFEIVGINANAGRKAKNIIIMVGDGMGASHRTAARIMLNGYAQGKTKERLAMDSFPNTAMIMTASLNSIITDSAPGMSNYVTGNKAQNNQEGVWPDDTKDAFDNPRFEYVSEFLARTQGKKLGIVTTADVFDATPAANAVHTSNRGAGTGIVDQFFDDANKTGLTVLMGGGRKWFLPNGTPGSARAASSDYSLPADIISAWGVSAGAVDPARNLISDFQNSGWTYASDLTSLNAAGNPNKLLGLFAYSNMNVALDKIAGRRGNGAVVNDFGFPNQPMLDEMTQKALDVLDANSPNGFVLMVEAASIDKQAHNMDSDRFIVEAIEFDYAIKKAKDYAETHPDTLVLVTADHECAGVAIIGASTKTDADLAASANTVAGKRDAVVGVYDAAGFPKYTKAADGYPVSTDPDYKMLIGYASNVDRYEDWRTNAQPLRDSQQPFNNTAPLNTYPTDPLSRDAATGFLITGQIPLSSAVAAHTGGDIPLSALGRGANLFGGVMDNTDVFFSIMQAAIGGAK
ncbi:MAG TPA: alkaline phosphatase [Marinagarivorans sp.]|nr:alkaline phosphatase [Marinagarivorans sp.]HNG60924.1 alkaline phosphatase [Cellvibrionaceae bacterium]